MRLRLVRVACIACAVAVAGLRQPSGVAAQSPPPPSGPAAASDVAKHLAAIARDTAPADTIMGADTVRVTLGPGARYVADVFARLGLQRGARDPMAGPDGSWYQPYPAPGMLTVNRGVTTLSIATFLRKDTVEVIQYHDGLGSVIPVRRDTTLSLATDVLLDGGVVRQSANGTYLGEAFGPRRRPVPVLVAGPHTPATAAPVERHGKLVVYVPPAGADSAATRRVAETLARGSKGVLVLTTDDAVSFAARVRATRERPLPVLDDYMSLGASTPNWIAHVRADSTIVHLLALAGADFESLRHAGSPVSRAPMPFGAWMFPILEAPPANRPQWVNVLGVIEGADSALKRQYVVVSAHVDRTATGAPTDASGAAALLEAAAALGASARPKRSVLFVLSSGAGHDFAGAEFVAAGLKTARMPVAANVTLDRLDGRAHDSVAIDGLREIDFGAPANWIATMNANLGLTTLSGSVLTAPCADQCAFVRRKVPSLYVHDVRADSAGGSHAPTSRPAAVDTSYTARVARLAASLIRSIANAERAPRWTGGALERLSTVASD